MAAQAKKYEKVNRDKREKIHLLSDMLVELEDIREEIVQECMATSLLRNARMEVTIRIFIIIAANTEI